MSFVVMLGGAGATASQQWKLPNVLGVIILATAVICTVIFGLNGILNILSKIRPVIILMILIASVIPAAIVGAENIFSNMKLIDSGTYSDVMEQVGGGNPFLSGASYGGFFILWFAAFLAEIGAKNKLNNVNIGTILSAIFIFGTATVCCLVIIGHIELTAVADILALVLAKIISPFFAEVFAIVICIGIYTS